MENFFSEVVQPWSYKLLIAVVVFIVGRILVKVVMSMVRGIMTRAKTDEILVNFVSSILNMLLMLVVVVVSLDQLGVDTTSLVALVGAAGLAVGLALKDSLQNFAAGVMLVLFRPFKTGDFVEIAGVSGVVEKITIFSTLIRTGDNKEVIVPNGSIYSGTIINYSARDTRRIDLVVGVDYSSDVREVKRVLEDILNSHPLVLKDPEPVVALVELGDSSVNFNFRPWVKTDDYWSVRAELLEQVKLTLDEQGIGIPFPQMDVHLFKEAAQ
ncbi:mechanosensitive ion channel family protein [Litoribrevibacter albus]|uniref:Small-conductance mechanosensitive channel n=1 Tax=Litoribrevibacter albus TaxID=1473156 RepID=A0AA37SCS7_9GAMM|nr:mechanosensitive ion channel domain-containing protein [Litoribrevibacter albus]GLQ32043.1 mechanosensitive ion channel protein [Litoribrevibacter albus]